MKKAGILVIVMLGFAAVSNDAAAENESDLFERVYECEDNADNTMLHLYVPVFQPKSPHQVTSTYINIKYSATAIYLVDDGMEVFLLFEPEGLDGEEDVSMSDMLTGGAFVAGIVDGKFIAEYYDTRKENREPLSTFSCKILDE